MQKISILGFGALGAALAQVIAKKQTVYVWDINTPLLKKFRQTHKHPEFPQKLSGKIKPVVNTSDLIKDCDYLILAVPSSVLQKVAWGIKNILEPQTKIITTSKGLVNGKYPLIKDFLKNDIKLTDPRIAHLSGPSFATDLVADNPASIVLASSKLSGYKKFTSVLDNKNLQVVTSTDVNGVQIAGAAKNIYAMIFGVAMGLKLGDSARGLLATTAINEIGKLITTFGGKKDTIMNPAGIGDFIATAFSEQSRNVRFGQARVRGTRIAGTIEGFNNIAAMYKLAHTKKLNLPLLKVIYSIFIKGGNPKTTLANFYKSL